MQITLAALSDTAQSDAQQKLTIVGIFDSIWATAFPASHAQMALSIRVRYEYGDSGREIPIEIILEDEDGQRTLTGETKLDPMTIAPGDFLFTNHILMFAGLVFARAGKYLFRVMVGDQRVEIPFHVMKRPEAEGQ